MTVYVVHPVRDNIAPALRFGDFKFITGGYVYGDLLEQAVDLGPLAHVNQVLPRSFQESLEFAARQFDPQVDYLMIAGDHLQLILFSSMLAQLYLSYLVLRYDRKLDDYIPVRIGANLVRHPTPVLPSANIGATDGENGNQEIEYVRIPRATWDQLFREAVSLETVSADHFRRKPPG